MVCESTKNRLRLLIQNQLSTGMIVDPEEQPDNEINSWFVFTLSEIVECKLEREAKIIIEKRKLKSEFEN